MGMPRLERCCFVFDLKTGNIVIGCLNAFLSFVMFVTMIVVSASVESADEAEAALGPVEPEVQAAITGLYVMSIILVFMFLAKFIFDVVFVYGVVTERSGIIRAYFIMWIVFILLSMFTFFLNAPHYNAGTICLTVFYLGLNIYAILLSYSFYKQLNEREEI